MRKLVLLSFLCIFMSFLNAQHQVSDGSNLVGTSGQLSLTVTTGSAGGEYSPKNVLAIWIKNSSGTLVNTMLYYTSNANSSATYLSNWYSLIGSWVNRNNQKNVDGVSGATQLSHGTRTCNWGKSVNISSYPDGNYTVVMELVDQSNPGPAGSLGHKMAEFTFTKGPAAQTLTPASETSFSNITIKWEPVLSGVHDVRLESLYNVYPNPATTTIYVSGSGIENVQILSEQGKLLMVSSQQKLDVSKLAKGLYLISISTDKGLVVKKFSVK